MRKVSQFVSKRAVRRLTNGSEAQLLDEFPPQILNDHFLSANCQGLLLYSSPIFLLADIGEEADDLIALLFFLLVRINSGKVARKYRSASGECSWCQGRLSTM